MIIVRRNGPSSRFFLVVADHLLLGATYSSSSPSWLTAPGNPLMLWPSSKPSSRALPDSDAGGGGEGEGPPPSTDQDRSDADAISRLLRTASDPAAALLDSGVVPRRLLVESLLRSSSHNPDHLAGLARWAPSTLPLAVDLLAKSRSFDAAWSLLLRFLPVPLSAFSPLLRRYARANLPLAALRTFRFLHRHPHSLLPIEDPFDLLIDALCKEGHTPTAAEFIHQHRTSNPDYSPSIRCYNILLHGWFRSRRLRKAERLWDEIRHSSNLRPTVVTYGTLIEGLCRMRRPERAISLLDEMKLENIEPNLLTCNPIVDALSEAGRFKEALGMLEKFPLYHISPNISTYNSLVKGFCKNGDLVGASKILKSMIGRGVAPTTTTYNYFFRHFSRFGKIEEGMNLYTKMVQSGYAPDRLTYELLVKMLCENERLDLAVQLVREMNRNGFDSDLDTSTMMVHLLCRMRRYKDACLEFEGMIKRGIVPQYITYRMLVKELKRLGMGEMERRVSDLMDSVPHSTKLPGTYREREGDETVKLRKAIMRKAQVMSDALKTSKDSKDPSNLKSSSASDVESADRLISHIRRRVYAVKTA